VAGETNVTIIGNLVEAPELRFTPSGAAVANFTVASTPRSFDKASGEWRDGDALFMRCALWRQPAENLAESGIHRGTRVIVTGRLKQRSFEKDGQKRSVIELDVDEIGPSVRYATVQVNKVTGPSSQPAGQSGGDPWPTAAASEEDSPF
jgi:single-strand DNA-binding protein